MNIKDWYSRYKENKLSHILRLEYITDSGEPKTERISMIKGDTLELTYDFETEINGTKIIARKICKITLEG